MTNIHTNTAATAALNTLRSISGHLDKEQSRISSGLRVQTASDNAAYWSISTRLRSDNEALSAVADALSLGAAVVDTAYSGLSSVIEVLDKFKSRLVAAKEDGVDQSKIQTELEQLKAQVHNIAQSASFAGQNWLVTDIEDITDPDQTKQSLVSGFNRGVADKVSVQTTEFHLSDVSLFNSTKGGLLQEDGRDMATIGGIRTDIGTVDDDYPRWVPLRNEGTPGRLQFDFAGPLAFQNPGDQIAFDITLDKDDPSRGITAPFSPGITTSIVIDRSTIDAVDSSLNGVIATHEQMGKALNHAFQLAHAGAHFELVSRYMSDGTWGIDPVKMVIETNETSGDGSYVEISNLSSTVGSGGLQAGSSFGSRGSGMTLDFKPFEVYKDGGNPDGTTVSLNFSVDHSVVASYSFNRTDVNTLLGKTTGKVETADEMVTLLQSLLSADWPDVIIETTDPSNSQSDISVRSDVAVDRLQGRKSHIGFSNIAVSIEPLSIRSLDGIDIEQDPGMVNTYIRYVDSTMQKVIDGAAKLGALKSRIDMQADFTKTMMQTIDKGIGRLVDNNMDASSARLKALQAQQQLGFQSLNIANNEPSNILRLYQ